jgi:hypothetical protein
LAGLTKKEPSKPAAAQASSPSGIKGKKKTGAVRMLGDRIVKPFLYDGRASGHGKYFAGYAPATSEELKNDSSLKDQTVWDTAILDEDGKPAPFRICGELISN